MNQTNIGRLRYQVAGASFNQSLIAGALREEEHEAKPSIFKEIKQLFFDNRYKWMQFKLQLLFICCFNLYYLGLYNSS